MQARIAKSHELWLKHKKINNNISLKPEVSMTTKVDTLRMFDLFLNECPPLFKDKSFDQYQINYPDQENVKNILLKFINENSKTLKNGINLTFTGYSGTGKTFASICMCKELSKKGFKVRYEPSLQFLKGLQEKKFESNVSYQNLLCSYLNISFLVIDEVTLGNGRLGSLAPWEQNLLQNLINLRYNNKLSTLIISNDSKEKLIEKLGEPIIGRLNENGITLAFNWKSYRKI